MMDLTILISTLLLNQNHYHMKEYLLLFYNQTGNGTYITTPADILEDMPKWQQWIGNIALQGKLISSQPIEYNGIIVNNRTSAEGPFIKNEILLTGFMICKAESQEEVIAWSKNCPILKYPNASVEIRPLIPFTI